MTLILKRMEINFYNVDSDGCHDKVLYELLEKRF